MKTAIYSFGQAVPLRVAQDSWHHDVGGPRLWFDQDHAADLRSVPVDQRTSSRVASPAVDILDWHDAEGTDSGCALPVGLSVILVLAGEATFLSNDRCSTMAASYAYLIWRPASMTPPRFVVNTATVVCLSVPASTVAELFDTGLDRALEQIDSDWDLERGHTRRVPLAESSHRLALRVLAPAAADSLQKAVQDANAWLLVVDLLAQVRRAGVRCNPATAVSGRSRMLAERAAHILRQRPYEPHTLQSVARAVGLSRSALANAFRQCHGVTVNAFLRAERMRRATLLLETGEMAVSEIAAQVGYEDPSSFARAFRRFHNKTPCRLRRDSAEVPA